MPRYIFLRIAWMERYQGVNRNDIPIGAGSYVTENADGGEVYNFYPIHGKYYGYARIQNKRSLRLQRLGAGKNDPHIEEVTIVFFARHPETGGQRIVGWYKNASLYSNIQLIPNQKRKHHPYYLSEVEIKNAYLVPEEDRLFPVPDDGPGQSNAWYVEEYHRSGYLRNVIKYMDDPDNYIFRKPVKRGNWQMDAKLRQKIEFTSMQVVAEYFEGRNYSVEFRHTENLGWDLEATLGKQTLLLEVKGLSGDFNFVDFTPNEYDNCTKNKKNYRICVVSNVLKKHRKLDIFFKEKTLWVNRNGDSLSEKIRQSARFFLKK